jgi:FtsP/CotA-like multicopper oxidase with cupredoxin domain
MNASSVNLHYHGTNLAPVCGQDEVLHTYIDSGGSFTYDLHFPADEPPGLYWYHPHVHGISEAAVQGGATGAIVVEGIENAAPEVADLPERILIMRDSPCTAVSNDPNEPTYDLSLNYIPVNFPAYVPARIPLKAGEKQFWRMLNSSADAILDIQLLYDGVAQPLNVVALDGVPTGNHDGTGRGSPLSMRHIPLAPGARAEFIVTGPSASVKTASLTTLPIETGPDGDNDPLRQVALLETAPSVSTSTASPNALKLMPAVSAPPSPARFEGLATATVTAHRKLYFSEVLSDPSNPNSPTNFYITVDGAQPQLFSPNNPPAITTTQGAVEDWTIENRAQEVHAFHIHQIHFLLLEQNNQVVPDGQYLDTVQVPYWSGTGAYPSVKVRMDFRGPIVGDFVYHCHILGHEDAGMMAIIHVNPKPN